MTSRLAPSRDDGPPARVPTRVVATCLGVSLAAACLFWSPLLFGGALHGFDWSSHHFHYFDWVRISLTEHGTLPLYMADAWITPNFLANAEAPTLGPLVWLLPLLPTGGYIKLLLVVHTAAGLAGAFLLLRDLGVGAAVASLAAAGFAWSGFFVAHLAVGHHWAMGVHLLPLLLWLYRRSALGSDAALLWAALLNAFTILGGQHQPFIWQNLFLAGFAALWALRVRAAFPLARLALLMLASAGFAAVKLLPLWLEFADYTPSARIQGLPWSALPGSLSAGGQGPEIADPRIAYEYGAGWWEYAFYVGPLGLILLVTGCAASRGAWPLLVLGAFFAALAVEPLGIWPLLADLPVWRSQRGPSRFLVLALFAGWMAAALGLERLRAAASVRFGRVATIFAWTLAAVLALDLWLESGSWQRAGVGTPIASREHRPQPEAIRLAGARIELREFAPNRLVYRVESEQTRRLVFPVRFGRRGARGAEWDAGDYRPLDQNGKLALELAAGERDVVLYYRPPGLVPGAAVSSAAFLAAVAWALRRRWGGSVASALRRRRAGAAG